MSELIFKVDFTAKRVLYRRDRRVRRALLKKISALSAFSAMSFCSGLKVHHVRAKRAVASDKIGAHPLWALQPARSAPPPLPARHFQYPQSDRGRCNRMLMAVPSTDRGLSVSSVGSWALQPPDRRMPCRLAHLSVSSVGSWALQRTGPRRCGGPLGSFQYPQSDRGRCNVHRLLQDAGGDAPFQYPQSDRGRCNSPRRASICSVNENFQYPQSDRGRCNGCVCCPFQSRGQLSVSSVGSWALQRPGHGPRPQVGHHFQYPQSDRGRCNQAGRSTHRRASLAFQYPQSDRGRCNTVLGEPPG